MFKTVFQCQSYKEFLQSQLEAHRDRVGYKAQLAKTMRVPASFLSQVLHSKAHLSMDHAFRLTRFWGLSAQEQEVFLDLIQLARAVTPELKEHLKARIEVRKKQNQDLSERLQQPAIETTEQQWSYYTVWQNAATHLLTTIPSFQTPQAIAARLQLPIEMVQNTLNTLKKMDLVEIYGELNQQKWKATQKSLHLSKQSPASPVNHMVWRQRAVFDMYSANDQSLHYTTLHTLSRSDFERIREMILTFIDETRQIVTPSPEEELICLMVDCFRV